MAKNYVQNGDTLEVTAGAAIASGDVVVAGKFVGVAINDIANGEVGDIRVTGVWELAAKSADVIAVGDLLYWHTTNLELTKTATGAVFAGHAFTASGNGEVICQVKLSNATA